MPEPRFYSFEICRSGVGRNKLVRMNTEQTQTHWDALKNFGPTTAIEIRFHANRSEKAYQMVASCTPSGLVSYTLHYNPRGNYPMSLNYITGSEKTDVTLPMKAYLGWQSDILAWIISNPYYTVDQVC